MATDLLPFDVAAAFQRPLRMQPFRNEQEITPRVGDVSLFVTSMRSHPPRSYSGHRKRRPEARSATFSVTRIRSRSGMRVEASRRVFGPIRGVTNIAYRVELVAM